MKSTTGPRLRSVFNSATVAFFLNICVSRVGYTKILEPSQFFLSSVRFHMKISPPPPSAVVLPHIGPADFQFDPGSHMNVIKGKKSSS